MSAIAVAPAPAVPGTRYDAEARGGVGLPGLGDLVAAVGLLSSGRLRVPEVDVRRLG